MAEPETVLEILTYMAAGVWMLWIGFWLGRRGRPASGPPPEVCECDHARSYHDKNGCHHKKTTYEKIIIGYREYGDGDKFPILDKKPVGHEVCTCVAYVGPHSSYVPELEG